MSVMEKRQKHIEEMREKFKPFLTPEFISWAKQDEERWELMQAIGRAIKDPDMPNDKFPIRLIDFEFIWLNALANYKVEVLKSKGK